MSNDKIIEEGWPEGHTFTVSFKVVTPGIMGEFIQAGLDKSVMHGCTVERVDLYDRVQAQEDQDTINDLQDALDTANKVLAENGLIGVLPNVGGYDDENP